MKNLQKILVGTALAFAALPSSVFAQSDRPAANFEAGNLVLVSLETSSRLDSSLAAYEDAPPASVEKSGTFSTKDGLRLRLNTDLGNVHIFTDATGQVTYRALVEVDSRNPRAEEFLREFIFSARQTRLGIVLSGQLPWRTFRGRVRVNFEVHIPRRYGVDIETGAGDIDVQDINGHVELATADGDITVGGVGAPDSSTRHSPGQQVAARLETQGGHITVGDVAGTLRATTLGGHITAGNIDGDGSLRTGGGHIHAGRISGVATLDTGGGNIQVASAGPNVTVNTAGGQIDFGEASGTIRARTDGGALRIEHVSGPTTLEASGGNIFLRQVDGPLHVSTTAGNITASFNGGFEPGSTGKGARKMLGASQLFSGEGDIIVYLSRDLRANIDAVVDRGGGHQIVADPSLPLKINYPESGSGRRAVRCEANLNGGGEPLHLKSASGNIVLKLGDASPGMNASFPGPPAAAFPERLAVAARNPGEDEDENDTSGFIEEMVRRVEESWWGGVPVDSDELQKHLENSVTPAYPEVARDAGIEGDVVLRVYVSSDGRVTNLRVLAGPPILARAAIDAVQQWRYQPLKMNGRPANVVATLIVAFHLR